MPTSRRSIRARTLTPADPVEPLLSARIDVRALGKPTMTAHSKHSDGMQAYWAYCDILRAGFNRTTRFVSARQIEIKAFFARDGEALDAPHDRKPDASNILKGVEDALLVDDSLIYRALSEKYWSDHDLLVIQLFDVRY